MKVSQIAEFLNANFDGDGTIEIVRAASLSSAVQGEISFVENSATDVQTRASCLLVPESFAALQTNCAVIKVVNPKLAFARIAAEIHPPKKRQPLINAAAVISASAEIGADSSISTFVYVGGHVKIGRNCTIYPHVYIGDDSIIGDNVILHSGVKIGADGFGYVRDGANGYVKFPQIGRVVIENDVEIGANSCIDRGALGETVIGAGTKIDNLVQIAHNVKIGKRVIIAAQTGISGSTVIEDDCIIGGQVGMGDHATVKSGAVIGSQAGVLPGKIVRAGVWWGTPVQKLDEYKRQNAMVKGLARLREQVKLLADKLNDLTDGKFEK